MGSLLRQSVLLVSALLRQNYMATALLAQVHLDSIWRIVEARRLCILGVIWVLDEVSIRFA
jgi:hypothetical protein